MFVILSAIYLGGTVSCPDAGWSAVTSAMPNATLAGVLAGFMLNGIVVLLSRKVTEIEKVRALGLLFTAFVALGLDSYLFGVVTGDSSCHRAWSEAMLAAGLLGMGAVAVIAGFGLLVAEYVDTSQGESGAMLKTLFNFLRGGVALVVLTLLFMTSWNYLYAVLGRNVPQYVKDLLWAYLGIGAVAVIIVIANATTAEQVAKLSQKLPHMVPASWRGQVMRAAQKMRAILPEKWTNQLARKISEWLAGSRQLKQQVNRAIYSSLAYTIVSVLAASLFDRTSARPWEQAGTLVTAAFIATVGWVLLISLIPLFYLLVRCSPPFDIDHANNRNADDSSHVLDRAAQAGQVGDHDLVGVPAAVEAGSAPTAIATPATIPDPVSPDRARQPRN